MQQVNSRNILIKIKLQLSLYITIVYLALQKNEWHLKSDYLETLVLHRENEELILDGIMQHEQ